jgi:hypothetical protein
MKSGVSFAIFLVGSLFVVTMACAFYYFRYFPVLAVATEESPGTWLSVVLLSCSAGLALVLTMHRGWFPWSIVAVFLFLLAADEHFMLHERAKQTLTFSVDEPVLLIREVPVFIGATIGALISWALWRQLTAAARVLLLAAVLFGIISVTLDVIGTSAMWEETLKLVAELSFTCCLLVEVGHLNKYK